MFNLLFLVIDNIGATIIDWAESFTRRRVIFTVIMLLILVAHNFVNLGLQVAEMRIEMFVDGSSYEEFLCALPQFTDNLYRIADDYITIDYRLGEQVQTAGYNEYCYARGIVPNS